MIIKALLEMAQGLGMSLLVEGVETEAQADQLERLGCSQAQGFHFGAPAVAGIITELLRAPSQGESAYV